MADPVKIEKDVILRLSPAHLQRILVGLERMPLGDARETFSEIERKVVAQHTTPPAASKRRVK